MDFDTAFTKLIGIEGQYVNNPLDPGGPTNWGVTQSVARSAGYTGDMKNLSQDDAKLIYKKLYWDAIRADTLHDVLRYPAFDSAVNSGVTRTNMWLQTALSKSNPSDDYQVLCNFVGLRLSFLANLSTWNTFGKGWARRIAENLGA